MVPKKTGWKGHCLGFLVWKKVDSMDKNWDVSLVGKLVKERAKPTIDL
jgi:hypothetical protein